MLEIPALGAYLALVLSSSLAIGALIFAARMWTEKDLPEARAGLRALGALDAPAFTELVARAWATKGHLVRARTDGLRVLSGGHEWLIDCRHRRDEQVESEHLRSLMHAVDGAAVAGGILVSAGYCSDSLKRSTRGERLRVIDGAGLWQLLEPALSKVARQRARWRVGALRVLRVGMPLAGGLALAALALVLVWHILAGDAPPEPKQTAATSAAATDTVPTARQRGTNPPQADAITPERTKPNPEVGKFASEPEGGTPIGAGSGTGDQLLIDLQAISEVRDAYWSSDSQVQLSVRSAIANDSETAQQVCSALGALGFGSETEVRYSVIGNHGFEGSGGVVGCY